MNAQQTLHAITQSSDAEVFIVGGYVRDRILGRECKDHDFVVVGVDVDTMLSCGFEQVGADFPVFLAPNGDEFALARTERKTGEGYGGFDTQTDNVDLVDDLRRRDLTMNAMARRVLSFNPQGHAKLDDEIIDPFGGQAHMEIGVMVHCSDAFAEDPLRVLRVARFAARYRFAIEHSTLALMKEIVDRGEMQTLTSERVWQEVSRAMSENSPESFWLALSEVGASIRLFPTTASEDLICNARLSKKALKAQPEIQFAILMHNMDFDSINQMADRVRMPNDVFRNVVRVSQLFEDSKDVSALTTERVMTLLFICDAFRRPDDFFKIITPTLALLDRTKWARELEMCLTQAQTISFADLTEEEQNTLKGKEIGIRIAELQRVKITRKLKDLRLDEMAKTI